MSVEAKIVAALAPFGDPVEKSLLYAAASELPPQYYTFSCSSFGADFGDDEPGCERWLVNVHFFAPLYGNITRRVKRTKKNHHNQTRPDWRGGIQGEDQKS